MRDGRGKLLIFTEHRDTLEYLLQNLRAWGYSACAIHGGHAPIARPVKVRRRGLSPGQLVVSLAESQLVGGEFFSDLEEVRADEAGRGLRAVGRTSSAPTALQRAKDFRRVHCQGVERAAARVGEHLDSSLGRDPDEPVTVDLDATQAVVYGARASRARRAAATGS